MATIGLCMIVKDEASVILRCLESVRPLIDYALIEDTGSTDGTQDIIRNYLARENLPGEVIDEEWRDFAYNRSHALAQLRRRSDIDYALIMDADDVLVCETGFDAASFKSRLTADAYNLSLRYGATIYQRPLICRNRMDFRFRGVLHEFLAAPDGCTFGPAQGLHVQIVEGGARGRDPEKYRKDAAVLEAALGSESDPFMRARYTLYLAQSWRDAGEPEKALAAYLERAGLGFWHEEVFISLYCAAQLKEQLKHPAFEIIGMFLSAYEVAPHRAEALHGAARYCRTAGKFHQGYLLAKDGLGIEQPREGLFIQPWIYEYGLLDELAVNAYWSERYEDCLDACQRLLRDGRAPEQMRERIEMNARFAREKLAAASARPAVGGVRAGTAKTMLRAAATALGDERNVPSVLLAILAKQKERVLPFYLMCLDALDYPKDRIVLSIRTNNNTDRTAALLQQWIARVGHLYERVEFDDTDEPETVEAFEVHEWNAIRFDVLGRLRQQSLQRAYDLGCDYYFVVDVDNFIKPDTLLKLVGTNLPIVAPLLRHSDPASAYSNYHAKIDEAGYFLRNDEYDLILTRQVRGLFDVPVVHCTYLVRREAMPRLRYLDGSGRHEYVVFADSARKAGIPQYVDNREVYGYLTLDENPAAAMRLLGPDIGRKILAGGSDGHQLFFCCGLQSSGSTWVFNLARELCRLRGWNFTSRYADTAADLPWDALGQSVIIVKSHSPNAELASIIADHSAPAIITVRDPRDAVVSLMQRFRYTFGEALGLVETSARGLLQLAQACALPLLRYEDDICGSTDTVDRVAGLLGIELQAEERERVIAELTPTAIQTRIDNLVAAGTIDSEKRIWDPETAWHANHLGDGKIDKFLDWLTTAQQRAVVARTSEFFERFGYTAPTNNPPATPIPDIHLVNLDRSTDRLARFRERNSHIPFRRVAACDGSAIEATTLIEAGLVDPALRYRPGALGCALSHVELWRTVCDAGMAITIAEDDAVFSHAFVERAAALLQSVPQDWDIITWGYEFSTFLWVEIVPGVTAAELRPNGDSLKHNIDSFQAAPVTPILMRLLHQFSTVCYSVSPSGAKTLLERCLPLRPDLINFREFPIVIENDGIDCAMNDVYPDMHSFVCVPPLVVPDANLNSTIR